MQTNFTPISDEQHALLLAVYDVNTFDGWMAVARAMLTNAPDWTAIADGDFGYIVKHGDDICALPNEGPDAIYTLESACDYDRSAFWNGAWDGSTPQATADTLRKPRYVTLHHYETADAI